MHDSIPFIVQTFERNTAIIRRQTEGLTHADSLRQLPFRGNSLNWVLGHLMAYRCKLLKTTDRPNPWSETAIARYDNGSAPVTGEGEGVLPLEQILGDLLGTMDDIKAGLQALPPARLSERYDDTYTVDARIHRWMWHDSYHTGQTEILRQLAGKDDFVL